jgi:hypothetical protein
MTVLIFFAVVKLGDELRRLLFQTDLLGAIDLRIFQIWTTRWAAGVPIYGGPKSALYPPATFVLLWPLMGWLDFTAARWLWAATSACVLAWMVALIVRESGAGTRTAKVFVALMLLSMNAAGVTLGNGQLILHVLPFLLAGILALRDSRELRSDLFAAVCIVVALVKPSITAPFLWLVLVLARRVRPVAMIVVATSC